MLKSAQQKGKNKSQLNEVTNCGANNGLATGYGPPSGCCGAVETKAMGMGCRHKENAVTCLHEYVCMLEIVVDVVHRTLKANAEGADEMSGRRRC